MDCRLLWSNRPKPGCPSGKRRTLRTKVAEGQQDTGCTDIPTVVIRMTIESYPDMFQIGYDNLSGQGRIYGSRITSLASCTYDRRWTLSGQWPKELLRYRRRRDEIQLYRGVPQGSILGPVLWNAAYVGVLSLTLVSFPDDIPLTACAELTAVNNRKSDQRAVTQSAPINHCQAELW